MRVARALVPCLLICGTFAPGHVEARQSPGQPAVEAQERVVRELEAAGASPLELGVALRELALLYQGHERRVDAIASAQRAVQLLDEAADDRELALGLNRLGVVHWADARYDSAVVNLTRAQRLGTRLDDRAFLGQVYNNLGATHYQWGNYELAMDAFLRALEFRQEVGDELGQARVMANLGLTYLDWERFDEAGRILEEAIRIADRLADSSMQGYTRLVKGNLLLAMGAWEEAEASFMASMEHFAPDHRSNSRIGLARVLLRRGDPDLAVALLTDVLATARDRLQPRVQATTLLALAEAYRAQGDASAAIASLDEGLVLAGQWEQRPLALQMLGLLSELHEERGEVSAALLTLRRHQALRDSIFAQGTGQRMAAMEARAETERQERENLRLVEEQRVQEALIRRQRAVGLLGGALLLVSTALVAVLVHFNWRGREREALLAESNAALELANRELQQALDEVRTLKGLIPICAHCKRVRGDTGYWEAVESYIAARSDVLFSHSICTECGPENYGEDWVPGGVEESVE